MCSITLNAVSSNLSNIAMSQTSLINVLGVEAAFYCLLFPDAPTLTALSLTCGLFARIGRRIRGQREHLAVQMIIHKQSCTIAHEGHAIHHTATMIDFINVCKKVEFKYVHSSSNVSMDISIPLQTLNKNKKINTLIINKMPRKGWRKLNSWLNKFNVKFVSVYSICIVSSYVTKFFCYVFTSVFVCQCITKSNDTKPIRKN